MNTLIGHFPSTKAKWKTYLKIFLPVIAGSIFFALNGVVDNFMVGHIDQGQAALGAVNSWTGILIGFFMGTAAAGSVVMAQYYHAGQHDKVKEVSRIRFLLCVSMGILLAVVAWTTPNTLISMFASKPNTSNAADMKSYNALLTQAQKYIEVIAIQWILISFTFNYGNQLRELGYAKWTMIWGVGALTANITLNATLMYGYGMESDGAAWASVAGRIVAFSFGIAIILIKKIPIGFMPWTIFKTSKKVWKEFWKRWAYFLSVFTVTFFIMYRNHFYSAGYPTGSLGAIGVSGLSIVSLTGAVMNIFTVTFSALTTMSANFVGSELGKGNIKQARINSNELKGFNTIMALCLSILGFIIAICTPYMSFLSDSKNTNNAVQLLQVSHSMMVLMAFYPMWIWFSTSYRNGNAGGKGHWLAIVDWLISGPIQIGWLAAITIGIVPHNEYIQTHFWVTYVMFFTSDILKLIFQEIIYYKYDWAKSITKTKADIAKIAAREDTNKIDIKNAT